MKLFTWCFVRVELTFMSDLTLSQSWIGLSSSSCRKIPGVQVSENFFNLSDLDLANVTYINTESTL